MKASTKLREVIMLAIAQVNWSLGWESVVPKFCGIQHGRMGLCAVTRERESWKREHQLTHPAESSCPPALEGGFDCAVEVATDSATWKTGTSPSFLCLLATGGCTTCMCMPGGPSSCQNPDGFVCRLVPTSHISCDGHVVSCWEGEPFGMCVTADCSLFRPTTSWRLSV